MKRLYNIKSVQDVINDNILKKENQIVFLKAYENAKKLKSPRYRLTQGIQQPLIYNFDANKDFGHVFDAIPNYFLKFRIYPDGKVVVSLKLENILSY